MLEHVGECLEQQCVVVSVEARILCEERGDEAMRPIQGIRHSVLATHLAATGFLFASVRFGGAVGVAWVGQGHPRDGVLQCQDARLRTREAELDRPPDLSAVPKFEILSDGLLLVAIVSVAVVIGGGSAGCHYCSKRTNVEVVVTNPASRIFVRPIQRLGFY